MNNEATLPTTGFVRLAQVLKLVPVSRTSIWRWVNAGTFPKPLKLAEKTTAWRAEDVRDWINSQVSKAA